MTSDSQQSPTPTEAKEANELNALDATKGSFTIKQKKKEVDYSEDVQREIQKAQDLLQQHGTTKLKEAIDGLMVWEKKSRLGEDFESTGKVVVEIVRLCGQYKAWNELNEYITLIAKKRSQSKQAITKMVQSAMTLVDETPNRETKTELINALLKVSEGKIYVEVERARLVKILAAMKEEDGEIAEAARLLQDVQIETVGSMEAKEKIDFILEQMRVTLDANDYVRAVIISRKITTKSLLVPEHQDLKIRYYELLLRYHSYKKEYLEMCRDHQAIFDTPKVREDASLWTPQLQHMVLYVILAKHDNHQHDLLHRIAAEKKMEESSMSLFRSLIKQFTSTQLINWPEFEQVYGGSLSQHVVFAQPQHKEQRIQDLHNRVVEHNLRIISKFYTNIHIRRLASLLHLDEAKTENFVSEMVTSKTISAKIDRIDGVIVFKQSTGEVNDVLNAYSHDIQDLLQLVEKTNHLINKDYMIHQAKKKGRKN